jgi:16S rRNA (uracil1498-N3)-methyltransferase
MRLFSLSVAHEARMLRVPVSPLREGLLQLDKATSHYLVDVHRARPGTEFIAFDVEGASQAFATIVVASQRGATCRVDSVHAAQAIPEHPLVVVQAFSKGSRVDQVIRDATALDATEIWVVATEHSAVANAVEMRGRLERWRKIALESARQCGRGNIPRIEGVLPLAAVLRELNAIRGARCVLTPSATVALWDVIESGNASSVALLIGPEGGLSERERELSIDQGFGEVRLGPHVLRTEVATVVALSVVMAARG